MTRQRSAVIKPLGRDVRSRLNNIKSFINEAIKNIARSFRKRHCRRSFSKKCDQWITIDVLHISNYFVNTQPEKVLKRKYSRLYGKSMHPE